MNEGNCMKSFLVKTNYFALSCVFLLALLLASWMTPSPAFAGKSSAKLIKIDTRPKVTQKFILIKPDNPVAAVVLLDGGYGKLKLASFFGKPSIGFNKGFLARSREDFAKKEFIVAVPDVPSDKQKIYPRFRIGGEHAQDIKAIVSFLKTGGNISIWLVGMSAGTFSALNGAIRSGEQIHGIVLISSSTVSRDTWQIYDSHPKGILNMDLSKVKLPTLIVSHKEDKCFVSPPSDAPKIKAAIANSPKVEVMTFTGGKKQKPFDRSLVPSACQPLSPHGFYGIEEQVVAAIAEFIKANSK